MKRIVVLLTAAVAAGSILAGCGRAQPEAEEVATPVAAEPAAPAAAEIALPPALPVEPEAALAAPEPVAIPAVEAPVEPAKLVAKVNGQEITEADVQKVMNLFMKQMGGRVPPDQMAEALPRIRERILEELIMRRVMLAAVAQAGISLSDSEFAEIQTELAAELPPGMTLAEYMAETGMTEADMREQMTVRKMVIAKAEAVEKPSDEELQAFYAENSEGFAQDASVTASHILIKTDPADDEAAKAAKRERIEALRQEAIGGADFAELAKANSDCPSASAGGDLGPFGRGQMVPEFEDAAFTQPVGSVGDVVETQFGFHLIKVTEQTDAKTLEFEDVKDRIIDILYAQKQQDVVERFVDGLRDAANIERFDDPPAEETVLQLEVEEDELTLEAAEAIEDDAEAEAAILDEAAEAVAETADAMAEDIEEMAVEAAVAVEAVADEAVEAIVEAVEAAEAIEADETADAMAQDIEAMAVEAAVVVEAVADEAVEAIDETVEAAAPAVEEAVPAVEETAEEAAEEAAPEAEAEEEAAPEATDEQEIR